VSENTKTETQWKKKRKGHSLIYTHSLVSDAVVENHAMGFNPGVFWRGARFPDVGTAKNVALSRASSEPTP